MQGAKNGFIYTVPIGLKVHCARCGKVLESTMDNPVQCYIEEDSSCIYCLTHAPGPREEAETEGEREDRRVPRRQHRRHREWEAVYG